MLTVITFCETLDKFASKIGRHNFVPAP